MAPRAVTRIVAGQETRDGAGVRLRRTIGTAALDHVDPFLLLDEFRSDDAADYLAGFPDHPHRGFETVTYMLAGSMQHRDHVGNEGNLVAGSVQWMTAGRGIIHSEMPRQVQGLMWGFQLWVNLPARDKLTAPRYQDIPPERIPEVRLDGGGRVRVIAGSFEGVEGAVRGIATAPLYLDVDVPPDGRLDVPVDPGHNAFAYVFEGRAAFEASSEQAGSGPDASSGAANVVERGSLAVFGPGDTVPVAAGSAGARLLLVAAKPLNETIVRHGPFVMNTRQEILQAIDDFQSGRF